MSRSNGSERSSPRIANQFLCLLLAACLPCFGDGDQRLADLGKCRLVSGEGLKGCTVGYRTYGTAREDGGNVVIVPTWFIGTSGDFSALGFIGPGLLLDTDKYHVIVLDALGNGVSTSPSNHEGDYPRVTIADMVRAQYSLVTEVLGFEHARAVVGFSMGGMQAFEWAVAYPDFMDLVVSGIGSPRSSSWEALIYEQDAMAIEALLAGPDGEARALDYIGRAGLRQSWTPSHIASSIPRSELAAAIEESRAGIEPSTPQDVLAQLHAMVTHDVSAAFDGDMERAAGAVEASLLVIESESDQAVQPGPARTFAERVEGSDRRTLDPGCGHLAIVCDLETVVEAVHAFLDAGAVNSAD